MFFHCGGNWFIKKNLHGEAWSPEFKAEPGSNGTTVDRVAPFTCCLGYLGLQMGSDVSGAAERVGQTYRRSPPSKMEEVKSLYIAFLVAGDIKLGISVCLRCRTRRQQCSECHISSLFFLFLIRKWNQRCMICIILCNVPVFIKILREFNYPWLC